MIASTASLATDVNTRPPDTRTAPMASKGLGPYRSEIPPVTLPSERNAKDATEKTHPAVLASMPSDRRIASTRLP